MCCQQELYLEYPHPGAPHLLVLVGHMGPLGPLLYSHLLFVQMSFLLSAEQAESAAVATQ